MSQEFDLISNISDNDLIFYRFCVLNFYYKRSQNKELLNDIIYRDMFLLFLMYIK